MKAVCNLSSVVKSSLLFSFLNIVLTLSASGQASIAERRISDIDININGPKTVTESRIRNYMSVKPGQQFSYDKLDDDVKRLYESGLVDDVRFLAEEDGDRIKIIAEVETRPSLQAIGFEGNTIFTDSRLRDASEMVSGGALNDTEILKGKRNVEKLYKDKGYPDTTVSYRIDGNDNGYSNLVFQIQEGVKGEVDEIYFHGNNSFSAVELKREMQTKEKGIFSFFTKSGKIENSVLEEDVQKIASFYKNNGYLRAKVTGVSRTPKDNGMVDLNIQINEGARYSVTGIGFSGMKVFTYDEIWPALSLIKGDSYSAKKMQADIRNIRSYYGSKGYADANIRPDIANTSDKGVSITYKISEGKRYRVGSVNIQGNNTTKDHVIRREIPLTPGEWFNSVDLDITKKRLSNLNYFNNVQANGVASGRAGYRNVDLIVDEKRTGSLGFGAGFSSIDSIVGFINLEQTNFDITDPWGFTGGGQRFSASLRAGSVTQDFRLSLTEPWFLGRRLSVGGELYFQDQQFFSEEFDQRNVGGAVFVRKPLTQRSFLKAEYRLENVQIDVDADNFTNGSAFAAEDGSFLRSALKFSYVYDSRDSNQLPRKGHKVDASLTYAGIGGDVEAYTVNTRASKHLLFPFDVVLNLTGDFTFVDSIGDDEVPIFERAYLGGARNLRGFDFRDVASVEDGTRDAVTGEVLGGLTTGYGTAEVTFPIVNTVRGALFADVGFVSQGSFDFSGTLHADAGLGVRLNLPFGPFAVDYAFPLQFADQDDTGGRFQFYLDYKF